MNTIEVIIENTGERREIPQGTSLSELAKTYTSEPGTHPVLGAFVNNVVEDMQYNIYSPKSIRFFDIASSHGRRMYQSSLVFMLYKALRDTYPQASLSVKHSLRGGFYCTITGQNLDKRDQVAETVRKRMLELQQQNLPFESKGMLLTEAIELIRNAGIPETLKLLESLNQLYITINFLDGVPHKLGSKLVPSTGCLTSWDFRPYNDEGYMLQMPDQHHPDKQPVMPDTPKLFSIFKEHHRWVDLLHVPTITDLNRIVRDKGENHLIHVSEALHEKKYAEIADMVYQRRNQVKMVLLAGPSSSGKTTSCRRLSVQLSVLGFDVKQLSLDDYFVCRERTPKLPNGEYDFESVDALDIPLLNEHLLRLFKGERVEIPTFDFIKGNPYFDGKSLQLGPNSILVVEGIHALNPKLTAQIADDLKFRVYVSALTQIAIDDANIIHSSENRMLRRIVRDNNFRGWDAYNTLHRWAEVRQGEEKNIFPFQENADVMFNSALLYELSVLKIYAEPQLKRIPENCPEFAEAHYMLKFLDLIDPIDPKHIPPTSIMREFLGGSSFEY
ncbi:MAG: nucleoside kinase [Bacteroidales bacterium]|nr:nucleoside kinase [Bacteroidales bacterium]